MKYLSKSYFSDRLPPPKQNQFVLSFPATRVVYGWFANALKSF